jgi:hypothetical protein
MGFKENLQKKIRIDQLAGQVGRSLGPADSAHRIDSQAMRELLEMGPYTHRRERDLDLYLYPAKGDATGDQLILVLDNELKLYQTTVEDVALRKSPTVKEMVSIRNAIKILNDKDVVVTRKADTLLRIQNELKSGLDLSYTAEDIEAIASDGRQAFANTYADGVIECLELLAEILGYRSAPKAFQIPHCRIWGTVRKPGATELGFGPLAMYNLMYNNLKYLKDEFSNLDKQDLQRYEQVAKSEAKADAEGQPVFDALKQDILAGRPEVR